MDDEDRFWTKVDRSGGPDACWEWQACTHHQWGYGHFRLDGKVQAAHRVSWSFANGPIPSGAHVLHHCDNPPCVNARHLFLGDDAANAADREAKGRGQRYNAEKTHCPQGHEYTPENTSLQAGSRICRACNRERCRDNYARNREERIAKAVAYAQDNRDTIREYQRAYMRERRRRQRDAGEK